MHGRLTHHPSRSIPCRQPPEPNEFSRKPQTQCHKCAALQCVDCTGSHTAFTAGWRHSAHGVLLKCPNAEACPGNVTSCALGYSGLLCSRCAQGYRRISKNRCVEAKTDTCAVSYAVAVVCCVLLACLAARGVLRLCCGGASARLDAWSACSRPAPGDVADASTENPLHASIVPLVVSPQTC